MSHIGYMRYTERVLKNLSHHSLDFISIICDLNNFVLLTIFKYYKPQIAFPSA